MRVAHSRRCAVAALTPGRAHDEPRTRLYPRRHGIRRHAGRAPATACPADQAARDGDARPAGAAMHEKDCVACHVRRVRRRRTKIYTRADRKVTHARAAAGAGALCNCRARHRLFSGGGGARRRLPQSPVLQVQATERRRPQRPNARRANAGAGAPTLAEATIAGRCVALPGWTHVGDRIAKTFRFANYHETMAFVNAVAWIAHREDHHPDLAVHYDRVRRRRTRRTTPAASPATTSSAPPRVEALQR